LFICDEFAREIWGDEFGYGCSRFGIATKVGVTFASILDAVALIVGSGVDVDSATLASTALPPETRPGPGLAAPDEDFSEFKVEERRSRILPLFRAPKVELPADPAVFAGVTFRADDDGFTAVRLSTKEMKSLKKYPVFDVTKYTDMDMNSDTLSIIDLKNLNFAVSGTLIPASFMSWYS
jgi:hypothetical protein